MCQRSLAGKAEYKPFQTGESAPKYPRSRNFRVRHIKLQLSFDEKHKKISGEVTHHIIPVSDGVQNITLDCVDLHIKRITAEGKQLDFRVNDATVTCEFGRKLKAGTEIPVTIVYEGTPQKGIYFILPDKGYPKKQVQIWTQGEMEDTRHWIPCYDYPNNKATFEQIFTVRRKYTCIGNGELVSVKDDKKGGFKTWHFRNDTPSPAYLIMMAAGEFDVHHEIAEGVPLETYVPRGQREKLNRSFSKTGAMLKLFNHLTGRDYPYPKYAQICVQDFIFGGMENMSATILTDWTLHDSRAHLDVSSDPLVAHELAHQWFGDLLTCRDWSHIWLNEGFATYFETLFAESDLGRDDFHFKVKALHDAYIEEDQNRYRRPIVCNTFSDPEEMFDRHTYEKGASVLHMLRRILGDDAFYQSIRHYVDRHQGRNVITQDLMSAIEETTGQNLDWFFDQWVYKAGYPRFEVSHEWDESAHLLRVTVKQVQKLESDTPIFRIPFEFEVTTAKKAQSFNLVNDRAEQEYFLPVAERPLMALFDKGGQILKAIEYKKSKDELLYQLQHAGDALDRIFAARELGRRHSSGVVIKALEHALLRDPFYGVRQAAAAGLADIKSPDCIPTLQKGLVDRNAKVRRSVVAALGCFKDNDTAFNLVTRKCGNDASYLVRGEAVAAVAKHKRKESHALMLKAFKQDSYREVVRARAADGLAVLEDPRGLKVLREWMTYGKPVHVRMAALNAAAKLGKGKGASPEARGMRDDIV